MPAALLRSSPPSPPSSDSGFHGSPHSLPSPASWSGRSAPTLFPGAWPPAWGARTPIAAPSFGAYLAVPCCRTAHTRNLKKIFFFFYPHKMPSLQILRKKIVIPFAPYTPETARGRWASAGEPRWEPVQSSPAWLPRPARAHGDRRRRHSHNPSPPKSAEPGLTYRACEWERGPGAPRGAAGRRAEPQLRRSRRRGRESPDKARDGEAERRLMASPTRRAPPAPLRPPARPPRRSAAPLRALARQSRLGAAASRATRPRLAPPPPPGHSASPPSLPPAMGAARE